MREKVNYWAAGVTNSAGGLREEAKERGWREGGTTRRGWSASSKLRSALSEAGYVRILLSKRLFELPVRAEEKVRGGNQQRQSIIDDKHPPWPGRRQRLRRVCMWCGEKEFPAKLGAGSGRSLESFDLVMML